MKNFKLLILVGAAVVSIACCAAVIGALAGLALSFTSLPPIIVGGIIGSVLPVLLFCMMSSNKFIDKCINFLGEILIGIKSEEQKGRLNAEQLKEFEGYFKELSGCLKERKKYLNSIRCYVRGVMEIGVSFGIGAGLVALGFTLPAAICALTIMIAPIICISLSVLMNKAVECFSSKKSIQPDGSLIDEVRVEGVYTLQL
ncbi:hypothetical protein [Wolbachia endosymbiont of Folsomia candida]|uniref:hypothetical protein n=1 Tax=Wolbachia endosymbiont of Folsomia candida TaxID=169402 RepID=UPI001F1DB872|nr:hypothetical protein [Wolbachia endosymbiont of Folsomia candida]